jgi:hypothetical protein
MTTGWSTNPISSGGGGGTPKSKNAKLGAGSGGAPIIANRRRASQTCGPFG